MKKVISIVLIFVLALSLVACSTNKNIEEDPHEQYENINDSTEKLTLDILKELSQKENLTWSDFEKYAGKNIGTNGILYEYKINNEYYIQVQGNKLDDEPSFITLYNKTTNDSIEIREEDIDSFIEQNKILTGNTDNKEEETEKHIYVVLQNKRYEAHTTENKEVFEKYNIERKLSEDIIGDKVAYLEYNSKESAFVNNYQVSKIEVYEHKNHDRLYVLLMDGQYYLLARV